MNKVEDARFQLEMIMPYVNHLKTVVNEGRRIELRRGQMTIFEAPLTDQQKIEKTREELRMIAYGAQFFSNGDKI